MDEDIRRERVVNLVQQRIAAAPNPFPIDSPRIDIMSWMRPALVAAGIVLVSSVSLLARQPNGAEPRTVVEALGVPVNPLGLLFPSEAQQ